MFNATASNVVEIISVAQDGTPGVGFGLGKGIPSTTGTTASTAGKGVIGTRGLQLYCRLGSIKVLSGFSIVVGPNCSLEAEEVCTARPAMCI
jgi:hypothetical protein